VGVCLDTAHVWAAGYDLCSDYDGVWARFGDTIGFARLGCLHLNDSKAALGSHLDRHELIGEGTIGADVFRRIMTDPRLQHVPRIIETPKGDAPAATDARMLSLLRSFASGQCSRNAEAPLSPRRALEPRWRQALILCGHRSIAFPNKSRQAPHSARAFAFVFLCVARAVVSRVAVSSRVAPHGDTAQSRIHCPCQR
jgi:hypothetical protein